MLQWYYLAIASGVLLSVAALVEKHMLNREHATSFTAVTTIVTTVFCFAFVLYANFSLSAMQLLFIFLTSTAFLSSSLLVARLYRHSDVSSIAPITSTLPIMFLAVLSFVFLNETLTTSQYVGIVVLVAAMYLMLSDSRRSIPVQFLKKNVLYFLAAALLYAIGATILKYTLSSVNSYTFIIVSGLFMSLEILVFVFMRFKTFRYVINDIKSYKLEVLMFSVASVGYGLLYYLGAAQAPISAIFPMRSGVSIILTVFASGIILKEKIIKRIPLAIIMIVAMYLLIT